MSTIFDVLVPTYRGSAALVMTLTSLIAESLRDFRIVISDQTESDDVAGTAEVQAVLRILRMHGHEIEFHKHLPRRGMAEQREFLLGRSSAPYALFLDDDVVIEPNLLERMLSVIRNEQCGFVGSAVLGLSYLDDVRPDQQAIEFWEGRVQPEEVRPGTPAWDRHLLHNAANLYHVQQKLGLTPERQRIYRVAWVGGCVLYDTEKLRNVGGFSFWRDLPVSHCGEDVFAQLRVMGRYGGCGLIPSGAYHLELPTTISDRRVDAPKVLSLGAEQGALMPAHARSLARVSDVSRPGAGV